MLASTPISGYNPDQRAQTKRDETKRDEGSKQLTNSEAAVTDWLQLMGRYEEKFGLAVTVHDHKALPHLWRVATATYTTVIICYTFS